MELTPIHYGLLHAALGLHANNTRQPTRTTLPDSAALGHDDEVAQLLEAGHFKVEDVHGEGGAIATVFITDTGRKLALANPPAPLATVAPPELAKAPPKPRRSRAKPAEAAPFADDRTGDLLGDAAPGAVPAKSGALTVAPTVEIAGFGVAAMDPKAYVAAVYEPFNQRFDVLAAEADLVALTDEEYQMLTEQQLALPEEQRRPVVNCNVDTKEGLALATRLRAGFRDTVRLDAEKMRKQRKDPFWSVCTLLDADYKKIEKKTEPYEERFHKAIKDAEERKERAKAEAERKERERKEAIRAAIDAITVLPKICAGLSAAEIYDKLVELANREATEEEFGDQVGEAALALDTVGSALTTLHEAAEKREADEAARAAALEAQQRRLAAEAEELERQRVALDDRTRETEQLAARAVAQLAVQGRATAEIAALQMIGGSSGTARDLHRILCNVQAKEVTEELYGALASVVAMMKDTAIGALQGKLADAVRAELPDLHAEALEENAALDLLYAPTLPAAQPEAEREDEQLVQDEPAPLGSLLAQQHVLTVIDWDTPPEQLQDEALADLRRAAAVLRRSGRFMPAHAAIDLLLAVLEEIEPAHA